MESNIWRSAKILQEVRLASLHERFPFTFTRLLKGRDGSTSGHDKDLFGTAESYYLLQESILMDISVQQWVSLVDIDSYR